ncbi:hypothetical protein A3B61_01830 [Candidatus Peribacteria bacterium RIFCSPLOWO2_01_FULL_53_10]|nr:MAG: hypothetical protein A3B61_01830 [Candidatus Peribacteria bacterium RIFCSPLOWO2_01_FULL_53_10]
MQSFVEIGIGSGLLTRQLISYAKTSGGHVHAIDPHPSCDLSAFTAEGTDVLRIHTIPSLEILPQLSAETVLIDGDHNWYTVFHELKAIGAWKESPLIFLHDTEWPYGRRDMYYDPHRIPKHARHPCGKSGIARGSSELLGQGGLNPHLYNAEKEGGPRNGVRTAIEDFLKGSGRRWHAQFCSGLFGLGILVPQDVLSRKPVFARMLADLQTSALLQRYIEHLEVQRFWEYQRRCTLEKLLVERTAYNETAMSFEADADSA